MDNGSELRTLAFRLSPDAKMSEAYVAHPFWVLSMPEALKETVRYTLAQALGRNSNDTRLPISTLNKGVRLLVPDVTAILGDADKIGNHPWLYATVFENAEIEPASAQALRRILSAWIRTSLHKKVSQESREDLVKHIAEQDLHWHRERMDLTAWLVAENKTARPYLKGTPYNSFVSLPDVVASRIVANTFSWGPHPLTFRRAPRNPGRSGVELISWPPLKLEGDEWPSSVVLTLTLQTVPFQSYPELHCDISIRRWVGKSTHIPGKVETSIYLLDSVPWIEGMQQSHCFQVAPAAWEYIPKDERGPKDEEHRFAWSSDLVALLNRLHPVTPLPDPQQIKDNPQQYLWQAHKRYENELTAAIVYRPSMIPSHEIGTGVMPRDRHNFVVQLATMLEPELILTSAYQRLIGTLKHVNPFFPGAATEKGKPLGESEAQKRMDHLWVERRLALSKVAEQITIEIWWQTTAVHSALLKAIHEIFGYPLNQENNEPWQTSQVTIIVQSRPLGDLGSALREIPGNRETYYDRIREAITERVEQIITSPDVTATRGHILALVELAGADMFRDNDPKPAIKIGYGKRSRLIQCITPLPAEIEDLPLFKQEQLREALPERAQSAVRDLLRQCGVLGGPPQVQVPSSRKEQQKPVLHITEPLHYLAVWMIKLYRKSSATHIATRLPVIVHMASNSHSVEVIAPGFRDWMTYADASFALLNEQGHSVQKPEEFHRFLRETLSRCLPAFGETLLFCDAQNLRSQWWEWLQNEQITEKLPPSLERFPKLRIVRLRSGIQEIPEWYAQGKSKPYGFSQGVFAIGESGHVFACVQAKPATAMLSKEISKVSSRTKIKKTGEKVVEDPKPGSYAWNPSIVEMTVSCANDDDALMSAVVANELRAQFATHTAAPTIFPLPLHLASLLSEYVLPLRRGRQIYTAIGEDIENDDDG